MKNLCAKIVFLAFFIGFVPSAALASVVINEIAWMGTKVDGMESKNWWRYEWLELYNNTERAISLEGWKIELYRTDLDWTLELSGTISAQDYFLIVASDKIFSNYDLNYSNLGGKFINSGQKVLLKNGLGNIIDSLDCFSYGKWFAGDNQTKQTMERTAQNAWQASQNPGGTPGAENIFVFQESTPDPLPLPEPEPIAEPEPEIISQQAPEIKTYPSGVVINEILPSPEGPDETEEWIEIKNLNNEPVDISGWKIQDIIGSTKTYTFPENTKISAQRFLALKRPISKITLNNSGDELRILYPNDEVADEINYGKAPLGQSCNRQNDICIWSPVLTPGSENIIQYPQSEKSLSQKATASLSGDVNDTEERNEASRKKLAAVGSQIQEPWSTILIACLLAIFSGILILILKKKLKIYYNKNI